MRTIHRYEIRHGETELLLPQNADVLCVQMKDDTPCVWALVDDQKPTQTRRYFVVGTGHKVPDELGVNDYVGTFQCDSMIGKLVWHVFSPKPCVFTGGASDA